MCLLENNVPTDDQLNYYPIKDIKKIKKQIACEVYVKVQGEPVFKQTTTLVSQKIIDAVVDLVKYELTSSRQYYLCFYWFFSQDNKHDGWIAKLWYERNSYVDPNEEKKFRIKNGNIYLNKELVSTY